MNVNWTIESINTDTNSMVVLFSEDGSNISLPVHLPIPPVGIDIDTHIEKYSPLDTVFSQPNISSIEIQTVSVGHTGTILRLARDLQLETPVVSDIPPLIYSPTEESIKALIYRVLDEIESSKI